MSVILEVQSDPERLGLSLSPSLPFPWGSTTCLCSVSEDAGGAARVHAAGLDLGLDIEPVPAGCRVGQGSNATTGRVETDGPSRSNVRRVKRPRWGEYQACMGEYQPWSG